MNKKIFLAISLLLSDHPMAHAAYEKYVQHATSTTHVITSAHGVSASSELITLLQDIASSLSASSNVNELTTILQQINVGINSFDIQVFEQALQEALRILASSSGKLNALTVIEYTGILVESIAQLEAARLQSSTATSTVVTSTAH